MQTTFVSGMLRQPLSELVIELPSAIQIFMKYDLDFCCGGTQSLEQACLKKGLEPQQILHELKNSSVTTTNLPLRVTAWSTGLLIDFIVENYHEYIRDSVPQVLELLDRICLVHASDSPFLIQVREKYVILAEELQAHMQKEEMILFPALRELSELRPDKPVLKIDRPLTAMFEEHELAGNYLREIRSLTNVYAPPSHACTTFRLAYQRLQDFDRELINHIHLENNVLFKRAKLF